MDTLIETFPSADMRAVVFLLICVISWGVLIAVTWKAEKGKDRTTLILIGALAPVGLSLICYDLRVRSELHAANSSILSLRGEHRMLDSYLNVMRQQPALAKKAEEVTNQYLAELKELAEGTESLRDENEYFQALIFELSTCIAGDRVSDVVQPYNPDRPQSNPALKGYMNAILEATKRGVEYNLYIRTNSGVTPEVVRESAKKFQDRGVTVHLLSDAQHRHSLENLCLFDRASGSVSLCRPNRRSDAWIVSGKRSVAGDMLAASREVLEQLALNVVLTLEPTNDASSTSQPADR